MNCKIAWGLLESYQSATIQAPSLLKEIIEGIVLYMSLILQAGGLLLILFIPAIFGFVYLKCLRNCEGYYLGITEDGLVITSPVERLKIDARDISEVRRSRITGSLIVKAGLRRITIGDITEEGKVPEKTALSRWLAAPAPSRQDIRRNRDVLYNALNRLIKGQGEKTEE